MAESNPAATVVSEYEPDEYIGSFIWKEGQIAVAMYNKTNMEISISHQIFDPKPYYQYLNNIFRQFMSITTIIAGGAVDFQRELLRLANLPHTTNLNDHRVNEPNEISTKNFLIYPMSEKVYALNQKKILTLQLSGMLASMTEFERTTFLEVKLSNIHQHLVVNCLGNLLHYLEANWKNLFLRDDAKPIINDINVFHLDTQVVMNKETVLGLQIFAPTEYHPSGFKKGDSCMEGLSIYSTLKRCCSLNGTQQLRQFLNQPTRDLTELNLRYGVIEWCLNKNNAHIIDKMKTHLKLINDICQVYAKIAIGSKDMNHWKVFKRTIYNIYTVCKMCVNLINTSGMNENNQLIIDLANGLVQTPTLVNTIKMLHIIVNIDESIRLGTFTVRHGFNEELDNMKSDKHDLMKSINEKMVDCIMELPVTTFPSEFSIIFGSSEKFIVAMAKDAEELSESSLQLLLEQYNLKFEREDSSYYYFHLIDCEELHEQINHLNLEIFRIEQSTCGRLVKSIFDEIAELQGLVKLCGKLDALIAMATVTIERGYTKPEITDEKIIQIKNGRHVLLEGSDAPFTPNNTQLGADNGLAPLQLLIAPNASGKSAYLKQVGLIVFLAHIGCYVPAEHAKMCLVDSIYTQIYTLESMYHGASSFMSDLQQMGKVLCNSSSKSLILIDEFGKGTNVLEGKCIFVASLNSLIERQSASPFGIISTHYTDVYDLLDNDDWCKFKTFEVRFDEMGGIISTYKLVSGKSLKNYATECHEVKSFLDWLLNNNDDNEIRLITDNGSDTSLCQSTCNLIREKQILVAMHLCKLYLEDGHVNYDHVQNILMSTNLLGVEK